MASYRRRIRLLRCHNVHVLRPPFGTGPFQSVLQFRYRTVFTFYPVRRTLTVTACNVPFWLLPFALFLVENPTLPTWRIPLAPNPKRHNPMRKSCDLSSVGPVSFAYVTILFFLFVSSAPTNHQQFLPINLPKQSPATTTEELAAILARLPYYTQYPVTRPPRVICGIYQPAAAHHEQVRRHDHGPRGGGQGMACLYFTYLFFSFFSVVFVFFVMYALPVLHMHMRYFA